MDGSVVKNDFCLPEDPHSVHSIHVGRTTFYYKIECIFFLQIQGQKQRLSWVFISQCVVKPKTPNVVKSYYCSK